MIRNRHIEDTNIKLRSDLEKCKSHLQCIMRNNEVLTNSIEEFTYVDERIVKIVKKNELKKLWTLSKYLPFVWSINLLCYFYSFIIDYDYFLKIPSFISEKLF